MLLAPWLAAALLAAPKPTKLAVSEVEAGPDTDPKLAHFVTTLVTSALRERPSLAVTSQEDIKNLLGFQRQKDLLGCAEASCLAEVGGALGVDQMVNGSLAKIGDSLVLVLRVIDVHHGQVLRDVTRRLRNASQDALLDALPGAVEQLYPGLRPGHRAPSAATIGRGAGAAPALLDPLVASRRGRRRPRPSRCGVMLAVAAAASSGSRGVVGGTDYTTSWSAAQTLNTVGYVGQGLAIAGVVTLLVPAQGWGLLRPAPAPEVAP